MQVLVPRFILDQFGAENHKGKLRVATLFVDISGFTAVTESLIQHGKAGAEAMSEIMQAIFAPLIEAVTLHGGFIVGFAGDAFTAVFAQDEMAAVRAVAAAWLMGLRHQQVHETSFGSFTFAIKIGIADGDLTWHIWGSARQRHSYAFRGPAIDACAQAEHQAQPGDVLLTQAVYAQVAEFVTAVARDTMFWRVTAVALPPLKHYPLPGSLTADIAAFQPTTLLQMRARGEFRQVLTVFVKVADTVEDALLDQLLSLVARLTAQYAGYLCRVDFGDKGCNLLFFWGAPTAHENDLERALNFILTLINESPLPLRAGVTYRLAYAGFAGSELRAEYTCYGLGVNLAARLMMQAPWGQVWLDKETAVRAADIFAVHLVDQMLFKGFTQRQAVFNVVGRREETAAFYQGQFIGREGELAQLHAWLAPLWQGMFGGVTAVTGEAGLGKSRLVYELLQHPIIIQRCRLFLCQTDEILRQPLNPFRYLLRREFNQSRLLDDHENKARFEQRFQILSDQTSAAHLKAELIRTRSFLASLLDLYWPDSLYAQLEPALRFENTLIALKTFFLAESTVQPVIIQLEDVQWLDAESLQLLQQLTRNMSGYPLALLLTSRRADVVEGLTLDVSPMLLPLTILDQVAIKRFAEMQLQGAVAPTLVALLGERAEGNPFFMEQMLLYLQEQGLLHESAHGFAAGEMFTQLPTDVQAILIARLDRLTQAVREVVQTAAVLGREFEVQVLSQMLHEDTAVAGKIGQAEDAAIWSALSELRYLFRHALMRDAAYEMQLQTRLGRLHGVAAVAIEQLYGHDLAPYYDDLVYHATQARDVAREQRYLPLAAQQAAARFANREALAYYDRALILAEKDDRVQRLALFHGRVQLFNRLGEREMQLRDLQEMAALAEQIDDEAQLQVHLAHAEYGMEIADYSEAVSHAALAAQLVGNGRDHVSLVKTYRLWANGLLRQGHNDEAQKRFEQGLAVCAGLEDDDQIANEKAILLKSLAVMLIRMGEYITAREHIKDALSIHQRLGRIRDQGVAENNLGLVAYYEGDYDIAREHMVTALRFAQEVGERSSICLALSNTGVIDYKLGEIDRAQQGYEQAIEIQREIGDRWGEAMTQNNIGVILMDKGEFQEALATYQLSLALTYETNDKPNRVLATVNIGLLSIKIGDYDTAVTYCDDALQLCREVGDQYHEAETLANRALLHCCHHQFEQALTVAEAAWAIVHEMEELQLRGHIAVVVGQALAGLGRLDEAQTRFSTTLAEVKGEDGHFLFPDIAAECLAGLARIHLQRGATAVAEAEALLQLIEQDTIAGALQPMTIYWRCYQALQAVGDERARPLLGKAYARLQQQAVNLSDPTLNKMFHQNVAAHRQILAEYEQTFKN